MANNPMLPIPVPKSSVELIKPDDKSKFKDMVTVFEGMMKQSLANENYEYQTQMRQLSEEDRLAKLEQANYQFEKLRKRYGADVDYFQEHNFSPDVTEKELTMKAENNLLQVFQQRKAEGNPMTLAELGQYSNQISGETYKTLSGIIMGPMIEEAKQRYLEWLNDGDNVWSGTDTINAVASSMGIDPKWAAEQQEDLRQLRQAIKTYNTVPKEPKEPKPPTVIINNGPTPESSPRTHDRSALTEYFILAGTPLPAGYFNDVNLQDEQIAPAEQRVYSARTLYVRASAEIDPQLINQATKAPKFDMSYTSEKGTQYLVLERRGDKIRVAQDSKPQIWSKSKEKWLNLSDTSPHYSAIVRTAQGANWDKFKTFYNEYKSYLAETATFRKILDGVKASSVDYNKYGN